MKRCYMEDVRLRSNRNRLSGIRENALFALTMTQFTPIPIYNPVRATCAHGRGFFSVRARSLSSPPFSPARADAAIHERYSHLRARASSSLVICVATMADRRLGNYSVYMHACLYLSFSRSSLVSLSPDPSPASFLSAACV